MKRRKVERLGRALAHRDLAPWWQMLIKGGDPNGMPMASDYAQVLAAVIAKAYRKVPK